MNMTYVGMVLCDFCRCKFKGFHVFISYERKFIRDIYKDCNIDVFIKRLVTKPNNKRALKKPLFMCKTTYCNKHRANLHLMKGRDKEGHEGLSSLLFN